MAQINKPTDYFNTVLYTGNATARSITGVGFQPDWVWIKGRTTAYNNTLFDSVRGATKRIYSNGTDAESTQTATLTSFDSDGFSLGNNASVNSATSTFASWNWLADNTSGSSNTDGSITSTVSANTTSGFSIVSYTGTGAVGTIGHGLGAEPKMIIIKSRSNPPADHWWVYHNSLGNNQSIYLNLTSASGSTSDWSNTSPTSSVFTINGAQTGIGYNGGTFIAYCFAEKKGFSKFGSYTGNGSTDGTFIYTGFKPAFVITKCTSTSSTYTNWGMFDSKRPGYNQIDKVLGADLSDSENGSTIGTQYMDFLSNGFKCRNNGSPHNISGQSYIYMAFAESPLVGTNNIPATAR